VSYVDVSKTYATDGQTMNLFIGYAATFASYKTNLTLNGCRTCRSPYTYSNPYISVTSSKILAASNKVDENLDSNSNNDGLSVTYSISCTFDPFVCSVKHMLAEAIWYKAGAMIAEELKYSKRFNSIVTLYKADATELIAMYEEKMMESLNSTLQNMRVPDNYCFRVQQTGKTHIKFTLMGDYTTKQYRVELDRRLKEIQNGKEIAGIFLETHRMMTSRIFINGRRSNMSADRKLLY
jgi:hypothetical protein